MGGPSGFIFIRISHSRINGLLSRIVKCTFFWGSFNTNKELGGHYVECLPKQSLGCKRDFFLVKSWSHGDRPKLSVVEGLSIWGLFSAGIRFGFVLV